ncbi:hypothetical protein RchiOBHm_Chr1g0358761 [Rosa chinensis]|uniref:Uncharacterized protein n=1 Tax=Rosa chinensis TaxID=74649 RepID=A0A2P6SIA4_ROSCH|nr:hypothetical protein RchiOBHm_Chr1g0358761 [Rosa chinensis]
MSFNLWFCYVVVGSSHPTHEIQLRKMMMSYFHQEGCPTLLISCMEEEELGKKISIIWLHTHTPRDKMSRIALTNFGPSHLLFPWQTHIMQFATHFFPLSFALYRFHTYLLKLGRAGGLSAYINSNSRSPGKNRDPNYCDFTFPYSHF